MMIKEILVRDWNYLRPHAKSRWHLFTEDDLTMIAGDRQRLIDLLQQKYLYSPAVAELEVLRFVEEFAPDLELEPAHI